MKLVTKKQNAFTVVETITVLTVIAILAVVTACATVNSDEMKKKQLKAITKTVYVDTQYHYQNLLFRNTKGFDISKLNGADSTPNIADDTMTLALLFEQNMDLQRIDCRRFPNTGDVAAYITDDVKCSASNRGVYMGFYLNRACNDTHEIIEYLQDDGDSAVKLVNNVCGYVIYAPTRSHGFLGEDFFVIALGKRGVM